MSNEDLTPDPHLTSLVTCLAGLAGVGVYQWTVLLCKTREEESYAQVDTSGLEATMTIYPHFWDRELVFRAETLCHEIAHVQVEEYVLVAEGLVGKKGKKALHAAGERVADRMGKVLYRLAQLEGVDFKVLDV